MFLIKSDVKNPQFILYEFFLKTESVLFNFTLVSGNVHAEWCT